MDLVEFFDVSSCAVYVIDSHRPYHLANVDADNEKVHPPAARPLGMRRARTRNHSYMRQPETSRRHARNAHVQIRVLDDGTGELDGYPSAPDFSDDDYTEEDEDDDDDDGDENGDRPSKRRRTGEEEEERKRRQDKRKEIQDYYSGSYYGRSCASLLYELSTQLKKDSNDLLW